MKNTENNKKLYRRYLDDLYTTEDARQLLNSLHDPDNHETLNELSSDVWEETATQQPYTDLEREHYKREARQLLKLVSRRRRFQCGERARHRRGISGKLSVHANQE